jgi:hypothetical protein
VLIATTRPNPRSAPPNRRRQTPQISIRLIFANEAGGEVLVVDEWPDAASFLRFFESSPDIGEMMGEAGVTERPTPVFWREMDTPEKF